MYGLAKPLTSALCRSFYTETRQIAVNDGGFGAGKRIGSTQSAYSGQIFGWQRIVHLTHRFAKYGVPPIWCHLRQRDQHKGAIRDARVWQNKLVGGQPGLI